MGPAGAAARAVEDRLFRALAVLRVVVLANAVGLNLYRAENFQHPRWAAAAVVAMVVWTGVALAAYAVVRRRTALLLVADLGLAVGSLAVTPLLKGDGFSASLPGFWVMGALLAWAVHWRWAGGLVAGLVLGGTDLLVREDLTQNNYGNVFLLVIGGPIVGYMCGSLQEMATERDLAQRAAAAAAERVRLARAVHDGVLQVLALVQRRGRELGGDGAQLARLAGEQEAALRRLVQEEASLGRGGDGSDGADGAVPGSGGPATVDLAVALARFEQRAGVTVVVPAEPVLLPGHVAGEVAAAVGACLDNVARHVGEGAPAWVLLDDLGARVEVSVRDEGPGIAPGRLASAEAEGRMGVSGSVVGRMVDLGGTATLSTGAHGTEWELVVRRDAAQEDA
ncbi:MAG: histidine kinase [Nocardioides sp.]|nr:histidine kinase [Nocardioides sp.]